LAPCDAGYDTARRVWNGMVDKRPALIARCTGANDVVACVNFAREREVLISVRGGGHNYAGKAVCDDGLVIDLSLMKGIRVDQARRTVGAQAGLRLGELDHETQKFGLATTLGVNTDTGISGLTLGGGYGWLAVKHGLSCDNVDGVSKKQSSAVLLLVTLRVLMARGLSSWRGWDASPGRPRTAKSRTWLAVPALLGPNQNDHVADAVYACMHHVTSTDRPYSFRCSG
jgi:FAD binding domain